MHIRLHIASQAGQFHYDRAILQHVPGRVLQNKPVIRPHDVTPAFAQSARQSPERQVRSAGRTSGPLGVRGVRRPRLDLQQCDESLDFGCDSLRLRIHTCKPGDYAGRVCVKYIDQGFREKLATVWFRQGINCL